MNTKSQRTHFPLILTTDHSFFFTFELFQMAKLSELDFFLVDSD